MSRVEDLAAQMYAAYCVWRAHTSSGQGRMSPLWEDLRADMREDFLKLAERMTLE